MADFIREQGISKIILTIFYFLIFLVTAILGVRILLGYWQSLFGTSSHSPSDYVRQAIILVSVLLGLIVIAKIWSFYNRRLEEDRAMEAEMAEAFDSAVPVNLDNIKRPAYQPEQRLRRSFVEQKPDFSRETEMPAGANSLELLESWSLSESLGLRSSSSSVLSPIQRLQAVESPNLKVRSESSFSSLYESESEIPNIRPQEIDERQRVHDQARTFAESARNSQSISEAENLRFQESLRFSESISQELLMAESERRQSQSYSQNESYSLRLSEQQLINLNSESFSASQHISEREHIFVSASLSQSFEMYSASAGIPPVESQFSEQTPDNVISDSQEIEKIYHSEAVQPSAQAAVETTEKTDFDSIIKRIEQLLGDES